MGRTPDDVGGCPGCPEGPQRTPKDVWKGSGVCQKNLSRCDPRENVKTYTNYSKIQRKSTPLEPNPEPGQNRSRRRPDDVPMRSREVPGRSGRGPGGYQKNLPGCDRHEKVSTYTNYRKIQRLTVGRTPDGVGGCPGYVR